MPMLFDSGDNQKTSFTSAGWAADLRQAANRGFLLILKRFSAPSRVKGHRYGQMIYHPRHVLVAVALLSCVTSQAGSQTPKFSPPGILENSPQGYTDSTEFLPNIRFPLEVAPAFLNSQVNRPGGQVPGDQCDQRNYSYPWFDTFCELRSWKMPLCPSGKGHQGVDIRPATCRDKTHWAVAAEDGVISSIGSFSVSLQTPAGTLYRYLHMDMRSLAVKEMQTVKKGDKLGKVSNFFGKSPTTIHLHFDVNDSILINGKAERVQIPPYTSLIAAYKRLLAGTPLLTGASAAHAERRVALVIGNSAYQHTSRLANPKNDAADMAGALRKLGFEVMDSFDLDKAAFDRNIRDFAAALQGAKAGLFFFAGHGLQVSGQNYLVPIDAKLKTAAALDFEMVRLDVVQRVMEHQTNTNVLFLDACRDNPLASNLARALGTRSGEIGRGFAPVVAGVGTLISFSTQPGNVALDGTVRNSPFAGALVKQLVAPKDDLSAILIDVRNDVMRQTQNKQVPWEHSALRGRFYFGVPPPIPPAVPSAPPPPSSAAIEWAQVDKSSIAELETFRRRHPASAEAEYASARIEELRKAEDRKKQEEKKVAGAAPPPPPKVVEPVVAVAPDPALSVKPGSGESFRDCPECPEMVVVPAGSFMMGSPASEAGRDTDEGPQHRVMIARPFAVGKFEVTFAEWDACVAAGGCKHSPGDAGWGRGKRPVIDVSWNDITKEYLPWLSRKTGKTYRLLTEAEWEYAARGVISASAPSKRYWWGDQASHEYANYGKDQCCDGHKQGRDQWVNTAPVGQFPANPFGLHDMHGNVWEWVQDCWNANYSDASSDGSAWTTGDCSLRVLRGGSWVNDPQYLHSAIRLRDHPDYRDYDFGFRLARTL